MGCTSKFTTILDSLPFFFRRDRYKSRKVNETRGNCLPQTKLTIELYGAAENVFKRLSLLLASWQINSENCSGFSMMSVISY